MDGKVMMMTDVNRNISIEEISSIVQNLSDWGLSLP